jgi:hypothetical protein
MLSVPTSKPGVIVPLVSSAAWIFCVTSVVFPEVSDVGERDFEGYRVGVEVRPVLPPCPLRCVRGQSLGCNDSAYRNITLTHSVTQHIWNAR